MKRRFSRLRPLHTLWSFVTSPLVMSPLVMSPLALSLPAAAQSYPAGNVPPPPVTLDPGSAPATSAPVPDRPAPAPAAPVVVVSPDGKVTAGQAAAPEPTNYYVGGDVRAPADEPDVVRGGPVPELHVVRHGDTLWDICFLYFNDPWQWPKVWSYNPQITNPHWIFPGDLVRLLPRGMFSASTAAAPSVAPQPLSPNTPPPSGNVRVGIKQTAFVEQADLDNSSSIDGAVDEKVLLGDNDEVYIRYPEGKPPRVGETYSIYKPNNVVKSNGSEIGAYVRVFGILQIKSVTQDKRARGIILDANHEIERGLKVGPLLKTFENVPTVLPKVDAQGSVVAMLSYDQLIGQGEVLFIDLGKKSGVEVGNRMFVVRRGDAHAPLMSNQTGQDDRRFPARALGQVVIVDVGERISVGLVTLAVQEMSIGDIVMMQAAKP